MVKIFSKKSFHLSSALLLHFFAHSALVSHYLVIDNTMPPGHLSSPHRCNPKRLVAEPVWAPTNPLCFFLHFCGCDITGEQTWVCLLCLCLEAFLREATGKARCSDCTDKKKHLRKKSPPLFTLFLFIIIIIQ